MDTRKTVFLLALLLVYVLLPGGMAAAQVADPSEPGSQYAGYTVGQGSISIDPAGSGATVSATYGADIPGGQVSNNTNTSSSSAASSTGAPDCVWTPDPSQSPGTQTGGYEASGNYIPAGVAGQWYLVSCNGQIGQAHFVPQGPGPGPPGPPPPSPQQLMEQAKNHLVLPPPALQLSPAADGWQYVQMPTWLWVPPSGWTPITATARAGPVTVTVTAAPVRLQVVYQTGATTSATTTCAGPGTPYSEELATTEDPGLPVQAASPDCGWTWHESSTDTADHRYAVTAQVAYHLAWTVTGAAGGGDLGELPSAATSLRVPVGEIQAVNTAPG